VIIITIELLVLRLKCSMYIVYIHTCARARVCVYVCLLLIVLSIVSL